MLMIIDVIIVIVASVIGRKHFHVKYISLSYRIRGRVPRTQTKVEANSIVRMIINKFFNSIVVPKKNVAVRRLIIKMFAYSAIKIRANVALLYSVLNPDTSSDSPSAKSNGVRFVSAKLVINHKIIIGQINKDIHEYVLIFIRFIFMLWCKIRQDKRISDIDTSYEMVCAILRRDPRRAYFEFEHHPAINVE